MKRNLPYAYPARAFSQRRVDGRTLRWAAIRIPAPGGRERRARTCASLAGCQRIIDSLGQPPGRALPRSRPATPR